MFDENNQVQVNMLVKKVTDEAQNMTTTDFLLVQSTDELEGGDWSLNISAHASIKVLQISQPGQNLAVGSLCQSVLGATCAFHFLTILKNSEK